MSSCKGDCSGPVSGWSCTLGGLSSPRVCVENCGNLVKTIGEICEDGNTIDGDGCSSTCQIESGYTCTNTVPPVCTPICGDGKNVVLGECDDGDVNGDTNCKADCSGPVNGYQCAGGNSMTP